MGLHIKNSSYKPFSAKIMVLVMLMLMIFPVVSAAWEWDNVGDYDEVKREITIDNALGLGDTIATATLISPQVVSVAPGYRQVAELELESYDDYDNYITDMKIYDLNNGEKEIVRDIDYKIKKIKEYKNVTDYDYECGGKTGRNCLEYSPIVIGSHLEPIYEYVDLDTTKDLEKGNYTLTLWTNVETGDHCDWVIDLYGVEIRQWAEWSDSLWVGAIRYYDLNDSSGDIVDMMYGRNSIVTAGTPDYSQTGKLGTGIKYIESGETEGHIIPAINNSGVQIGNDWTVSFWVSLDACNNNDIQGTAVTDAFQLKWGAANDGPYIQVPAAEFVGPGFGCLADTFYLYIAMGNSSGTFIYINNTRYASNENTGDFADLNAPYAIGGAADAVDSLLNGDNVVNSIIDQYVIWNRSLSHSEISSLYNDGDGTVPQANTAPIVSLSEPANNTGLNDGSSVDFVCNATDNSIVTELNLTINGVVNETVTGAAASLGLLKNISPLADGNYNWSCTATNGILSTTNGTFALTVDSTPPIISIAHPTTDITDGLVTSTSRSIDLNWTSSDATSGLNTCWYFNQTANVTVTCGTNATFTLPYGTYTHIVYANDSLDNEASDSITVTYDYAALENSITFNTPTTQGGTEIFTLNLTSDGSESVTANFMYRNVSYASSKSGDNTDMVFSNTISNPTSGTNEFYWVITKGSTLYNSTKNNQVVNAFNLTDCSNNGTVIWNFTIQDEEDKTDLSGANLTFEISVDAMTLAGGDVTNFNLSLNGTNPIAVCTDTALSSSKIILDALIRHEEKTDGISEFYSIQNHTINNVTGIHQNITLYNLKSADAQEFKITYKDASFLPVLDSVLEVQRNYIGDGVYRVVERPPFDDDGDTLANLVLGDVIYTFIVKKDNQVLATFNNIKAFCDNAGTGDCKINLNAQNTHVSSDTYESVDNVDLTIIYDEDARTAQVIFSSTDDTTREMLLNVTTYDLLGNETVCSDTLTSSSGTLSCTIPGTFGNSSAMAKVSIDGKVRAYKGISLWSKASDVYGYSTVFLSIILFTTIVGIAISSSPIITLAGVLIGILANMGMFLINGSFFGVGSTFLWGVILIITVMWKVNRRSL